MKRLMTFLLLLLLAACSAGPDRGGASDDWISPGGDAGKSHHSMLVGIAPDNVGRLGLAWQADL